MKGLDPKLYNELREVLLKCDSLDDNRQLNAVFIDKRIKPWRHRIQEAHTKLDRVNLAIDFLIGRTHVNGENVLVLFLQVLGDQTAPQDPLQNDLYTLANTLKTTIQDE